MYLCSVFFLSSLGILTSTKADPSWLGSRFLLSLYWCKYLLNDCLPDKLSWEGVGPEVTTVPDALQDCALMSCHRSVQNKNSFWSSVSHYLAWLPLMLPLVSFSLLFCKLRKQAVRGTGQCLQTQSEPLGCWSWFLMWCRGRDLTPNKWWNLQASVLDSVCSNPRNSIAMKILHWMQGN